ncbi:hypothetical protein AURDEDRAFT_122266 [Auricularia subglabra TFB-10046 SS5]|nr:hypothetical protein AURDEDRAFT_122266 [Auricularia subglabra TFB-10046 SS5]
MWMTVVGHIPAASCALTFRVVMALQAGNGVITAVLCVCMLGIVAYQLWVSIQSATCPVCHTRESGKSKFLAAGPLVWDCIAFAITSVVRALECFDKGLPKHLTRAFQYALHSGTWRTLVKAGSSYTRVFLRDGTAYFSAIFVIHAFNTVMTFQEDTALKGAGVPASLLLPNVLVCRLLLHLRSTTNQEPKQTEYGSICLDFATLSDRPAFKRGNPGLVDYSKDE